MNEIVQLASVLARRPCAEGTGQDGRGQVIPAEGILAKRIGVGMVAGELPRSRVLTQHYRIHPGRVDGSVTGTS